MGFLSLIPVKAWLLGGLIIVAGLYHWNAVRVAGNKGEERGKEWGRELVRKADAANVKLHDDQQSLINIRIGPENSELFARFTALQAKKEKTKTVYLPGKPVPAICEPDPERVAWVNASRT